MYVLFLPVLSIISQKDVHPQHLVRESRARSCHQEKTFLGILCLTQNKNVWYTGSFNHMHACTIFDRRGSRVRRSSSGCGVAQLVLVVRRLAVWQAWVRFSARHPWEVFPLSWPAMHRSWSETSANGDGWMRWNECMYTYYCAAEAIFCCPTENSHHLKS